MKLNVVWPGSCFDVVWTWDVTVVLAGSASQAAGGLLGCGVLGVLVVCRGPD
jgi:hypothetical protein